MVVIVILGILAAVIAPRIPQFVNKAKEGKTKGNLGTLRSTLNIYYSDNDGRYPIDTLACLSPKYIKEVPQMETAVFSGVTNTHKHGPTNAVIAGGVAQVDDTGGWVYQNDSNNAAWGEVLVNCNGVDSTGNRWTSY